MTTLYALKVRRLIGKEGGLISVDGMAEAWRITRQAVHQYIAAHPDFPDALPMDVGSPTKERERRVWLWSEVDAYRSLT